MTVKLRAEFVCLTIIVTVCRHRATSIGAVTGAGKEQRRDRTFVHDRWLSEGRPHSGTLAV